MNKKTFCTSFTIANLLGTFSAPRRHIMHGRLKKKETASYKLAVFLFIINSYLFHHLLAIYDVDTLR